MEVPEGFVVPPPVLEIVKEPPKFAWIVALPLVNLTVSVALVLVVVPVLPKVTPLPETTVQFTKLYPPEGEAEIKVGVP
jgi:hypothetical protein